MLAKRLGLNASSPTTRQVLDNLDTSAEAFISKYRKGGIRKEFPRELLDGSVEDALKSSRKARKLLIDGRFAK